MDKYAVVHIQELDKIALNRDGDFFSENSTI